MPTVFQAGNEELHALAENPTLQGLLAYFDARTGEWPYPIMCMELFTVGVFFDLAFKNGRAFEVLKLAAQLPLDTFPDQRFLLALDLLSELATASGKTEMPNDLAQRWNSLSSRVARLDPEYVAWNSLKAAYGIK